MAMWRSIVLKAAITRCLLSEASASVCDESGSCVRVAELDELPNPSAHNMDIEAVQGNVLLSRPDVRQEHVQMTRVPNGLQEEMPKWVPKFVDEEGQSVPFGKESIEHDLIPRYIPKDSTGVLELGARYGTSSCTIAKYLGSTSKVVSVEADPDLWPVLKKNLQENVCVVNIHQGVVAKKPMVKSRKRNGSRWTTKFEEAPPAGSMLADADATDREVQLSPATTPTALEDAHGLHFDSLIVDCEGCFARFLSDFDEFLDNVRVIILEEDYGIGLQEQGYADYNHIENVLHSKGFSLKFKDYHPCCEKPPNVIHMVVFAK